MGTILKKTKLILIIVLLVSAILRLWGIDRVPVSLFSDELDVGYQAYSILKTGKDYFGNSWPIHFQSYADYRAPLYIYSSVPSVKVFGITPWGVRVPAAIFGLLGVWAIFLLIKELSGRKSLGLIAAILLTFSPWHIQYSRMAFEATMLITFLLFSLYFFFKSLKNSRFLWLSMLLLILTPFIYNTATLFIPLLIVFIFLVWKKQIIKLKSSELIKTAIVGLIFGLPIIYSIFFQGGYKRASYISVFTDPTTKSEVEYSILNDAKIRNVYGGGVISKVLTRVEHNKFTFWGSRVINNYISSLSTEFLFLQGDPNLRHSISNMGQFYKIEIIPLLLGVIFFFTRFKAKNIKLLILFWILAGILPAAITRDGGSHATRLILILPPLIFLMAYGLVEVFSVLKGKMVVLVHVGYAFLYLASFGFYQHNFWIHNVWDTERAWQAGYREVVEVIKEREKEYERIVITNANDDPRIFFASYYLVDPEIWQRGLEKEKIPGFGELEHIGKYYFGQVDGKVGITGLTDYIDNKTLYIASSREIKGNLIMEPQYSPKGLKLIHSIQYPSGEPAFYIFSKEEN